MDKIVELNKRLKAVKEAFDTWKKVGMDEDIMIIYIHHKTKIPLKDIHSMLKNMEEFFHKLSDEDLIKAI